MWKYLRSAMKPFGYLILFYFGFFLCFATSPCLGSKVIRTSAKSLAEKTGAAQYTLHIEEELAPDEISNPHDLRKRLSNENLFDDSDYEIYQGVVGRPGIDFPVMTGIPQTTFNCRDVGNGYFADLETECQVFHICEGGKKISFLCPNGTIFQQTELICDWWFKVNCAASPGHYAESSEVLSRAQNRSATAGAAANKSKPIVKLDKTVKNNHKASAEVQSENFDFEDIGFPDLNAPKSNSLNNNDRKAKTYTQQSQKLQKSSTSQNGLNGQSSQESQVFAASSSFAAQMNSFNGYFYKQPNQAKSSNQKEATTQTPFPQATSTAPATTTVGVNNVKNNDFNGYQYNQPQPDRADRRLQNNKGSNEGKPRNDQGAATTTTTTTTTTSAPITYANRGTTKYKDSVKQNNQSSNQFIINVADTTVRPTTSPPLIRNRGNFVSTTARYETTRTTPFYTPTVPSVGTVSQNRFQDARPTVSSTQVAEHAMEMMQTIQDLKLNGPTEPGTDAKEYGDRAGLIIPPSSGPKTLHSLALYFATAVDNLVTKPMPETTTPTATPIPGLEGLDVMPGNVTKLESSLVSDNTKRQYETLFGIDEEDERLKSRANYQEGSNEGTSISNNDLETEFSNNPVAAAAGTKQIRELAQVFTHALSAYLQDPSTFRRVLAEIRPTEPPPVESTEYLSNRIGRNKQDFKDGTGATYLPTSATPSVKDVNGVAPTTEDFEVLDFSDVTVSTPNSLPTETTNSNSESFTSAPAAVDIFDSTRSQILEESLKQVDHVPASRILTEALGAYALNQYNGNSLDGTTEASNPLAIEINGGLEATTAFPYLEEFDNNSNSTFEFVPKLSETEYPNSQTTENPSSGTTSSSSSSSGPLAFDLLPPANKDFDNTPPVDENDLQRAQSQSIYGNGKNNLDNKHRSGKEYKAKSSKNDLESLKNENGHYITEISSTATATPAPEFSKTTSADNGKVNPNTWSTLSYSVFLDPLTINDGLMGSNEQSTAAPSAAAQTSAPSDSSNYRDSTEPYTSTDARQGKAATPTQGPPTHEDYMQVMQRKANEMFGTLNDTSADHLMNVMKKADKSKTVRKLILLLIQTCDDDVNKTVEASRQAILNALIGMDEKSEDTNEIHMVRSQPYREEKALNFNSQTQTTLSTTTQLPITTYRRPLHIRVEEPSYTTTQLPAETTTYSPLYQSTNYYTDTTTLGQNYDYYTTTPGYSTEFDTTTTSYYQAPTTTTTPPPPPPTTTTFAVPTTTRAPTTLKSRRRSTKAPSSSSSPPPRNSKRLAKDLDQYLTNQGDTNLNVNHAHRHSDARALELLRSLYSLAGRFGK